MKPLDNIDAIENVARSLLRRADVGERLPTPVDEIVTTSGLLKVDDYVLSERKFRDAPRELRKLLRSASRKIRGALDRRERVLHVNPDIDLQVQRRFIECHEVMHDALPWQRDLLVLADTHKTLSPDVELTFEREANQGSAELLFQVDLLQRIAKDYPVDVSTPVQLAMMFGASLHSTFRRWIESQGGQLCGIVLDPKPVRMSPLAFRRYEVLTSSSWRTHFGEGRFPLRMSASNHAFLSALSAPLAAGSSIDWRMSDLNGTTHDLKVQTFTNSYRTFVLIWLPGRETFVARHRVRPEVRIGVPA